MPDLCPLPVMWTRNGNFWHNFSPLRQFEAFSRVGYCLERKLCREFHSTLIELGNIMNKRRILIPLSAVGLSLMAAAPSMAFTWSSGNFSTINGWKKQSNVQADGSDQSASGRLVTGCGTFQTRFRHEKGFGSDTTLASTSGTGCIVKTTGTVGTTNGWNVYTDFYYTQSGQTARTSIQP
jgi:hypothetical protein